MVVARGYVGGCPLLPRLQYQRAYPSGTSSLFFQPLVYLHLGPIEDQRLDLAFFGADLKTLFGEEWQVVAERRQPG